MELIESLKDIPDDTELRFQMDDGCCSDWFDLDAPRVSTYIADGIHNKFNEVQIRFYSLPHFKTCIRSGRMNRLLEECEKK
jgi:hypothetical protein